MQKRKVSWTERLEHSLVKVIQQEGADKDCHGWMKGLLAFLYGVSKIYGFAVGIRYALYGLGIIRHFPLGCQVISIGNVTAGGTGKTPVTELFARTLRDKGRKVAILSRGYRRKEAPWYQRMFQQAIEPPLVVSDGKNILLDAATGGDEPFMLASNLPGVCVVVDRNRVKAGRWAINNLGCDTLILDDGFQYQKLRHSIEVTLVDKTNPFGNGNMLPRGILREPAKHLSRADIIFLTKSDGDSERVKKLIRKYNAKAEIVECRHEPCVIRDVYTRESRPLEWFKGKTLTTLAGIASPRGFEDSLRKMGARVIWCERYPDHHRYDASEIEFALRKTAGLKAEALITTEKDAVRFPKLDSLPVPCHYLRIDIKILHGMEHFDRIVGRICDPQPRKSDGK